MVREVTDINPILTLSHTLHSTPTSHLMILGAGISIAAGVPSAWEVQKALVHQLAAQFGEPSPPDIEEWFVNRYGRPLRYQALLKELAPRPTERQRLLRQFFETVSEDGSRSLGEPSLAHASIARLVASGHVQLIVTLNFDHLVERALIAEGVQPTVVSSDAEFAGLAPTRLHSAVVVHLHGDYTKPDSLRNTDDELASYTRPVQRFLKREFADHGVIAVGWSAAYDPGLRAAITATPSRHFTSYWIDPFPLNQAAEDVRRWLGAPLVGETADEAMSRLADATTALTNRDARHPLEIPVAVATAKRQLAGEVGAINLHDSIRTEIDKLGSVLAAIEDDEPEQPSSSAAHPAVRTQEHLKLAEALIATSAYWGTPTTDQYWHSSIERLARTAATTIISDGGSAGLRRLPAIHLFTAGLVAAVAGDRWDLAVTLLQHTWVPNIYGNDEHPAARDLLPSFTGPTGEPPSAALYQHLRPLFLNELAVGEDGYDEAWELSEVIRLMASTHLAQGEPSDRYRRAAYTAEQNMTSYSTSLGNALERDEQDVILTARQTLADGKLHLAKAVSDYASTVPIRQSPHIRVALGLGGPFDPGAPVLIRLVAELERLRVAHPLAQARLCDGDPTTLVVTARAVQKAVDDRAKEELRYVGHRESLSTKPWWCDSHKLVT